MKYTVTYNDGKWQGQVELQAPERLPQFGDIYKWTVPGRTLGGHTYHVGDTVMVLERTGQVPYHRTSSLGNLLIQGPYGTGVWTCFEDCVAKGNLELVENRT